MFLKIGLHSYYPWRLSLPCSAADIAIYHSQLQAEGATMSLYVFAEILRSTIWCVFGEHSGGRHTSLTLPAICLDESVLNGVLQ